MISDFIEVYSQYLPSLKVFISWGWPNHSGNWRQITFRQKFKTDVMKWWNWKRRKSKRCGCSWPSSSRCFRQRKPSCRRRRFRWGKENKTLSKAWTNPKIGRASLGMHHNIEGKVLRFWPKQLHLGRQGSRLAHRKGRLSRSKVQNHPTNNQNR